MGEKKLIEARQELAELLKSRRTELKLTQEEVAIVCGWHPQTIYRIEKGNYYLVYKQLLIICEALDLELKIFKKEVR